MKEPSWRREGKMPDYRFSLANERTFLAWIRTALAILAGTIALDQQWRIQHVIRRGLNSFSQRLGATCLITNDEHSILA